MAKKDRQFETWLRPFSADGDASTVQPNSENRETPTLQAYGDPDCGIGYFIERLFDGELSRPIITFNRQPNSRAFARTDAFVDASGVKVPEISLNIHSLKAADDRTILSIIVAALVDLFVRGQRKTPGTRGYRSVAWAQKMEEVGLRPVGRQGNKKSGYGLSFEIIPGGPFDCDCAELPATGFKLRWRDGVEDLPEIAERQSDNTPSKSTRTRFECAGCGLKAWANPAARLSCRDCNRPLTAS